MWRSASCAVRRCSGFGSAAGRASGTGCATPGRSKGLGVELPPRLATGPQTIAPSAPWTQTFCATTTLLGAVAVLAGAVVALTGGVATLLGAIAALTGTAAALTGAIAALTGTVAALTGAIAALSGVVRKFTKPIRKTSATRANGMARLTTNRMGRMTPPSRKHSRFTAPLTI